MSTGNALALAGWILFALAFLLAVRAPKMARLLGGLASQHRMHHYIGIGAAALILLHAGFELLTDPDTALAFTDWLLLAGWLGLVTLVAGVAASFIDRLTHRVWIWIHRTLAAAWIAGFLHGHAFLQPDQIHEILFIVGSLLAAGVLAATVMLKTWRGPWIVKRVHSLSEYLHEVELEPSSPRARTFRAGAIVFAKFHHPFTRTWHPFSVASCRFEPTVRLLIKSAGKDTRHIADLRPGDTVDLLGPFLEFRFQDNVDQVWVAGGVGVAPFLGMTRCLDHGHAGSIRLIVFQAADEPELARELSEFGQRHPSFRWTPVTGPGLPDLSKILDLSAGLEDPEYLICGPPAFMKSVRKLLQGAGTAREKIKSEEYNPW